MAESGDAAVQHRFDPVRGLHFLSGRNHAGEGGLEELLVQLAVGHGAVEAADGSDPDREGLGLHRPADVAVELRLQRRRGAETFGLRPVEPPSLLRPRSLALLYNFNYSWGVGDKNRNQTLVFFQVLCTFSHSYIETFSSFLRGLL